MFLKMHGFSTRGTCSNSSLGTDHIYAHMSNPKHGKYIEHFLWESHDWSVSKRKNYTEHRLFLAHKKAIQVFKWHRECKYISRKSSIVSVAWTGYYNQYNLLRICGHYKQCNLRRKINLSLQNDTKAFIRMTNPCV